MEFLLQYFHDAVRTEEDVEEIKKLILQLAFQGKLVAQDLNLEHEQLSSSEQIPYELPEGWKWKRLGDIVQVISGYAFKSGDFSNSDGVKSIKITNVGVGNFVNSDITNLPENFFFDFKDYLVYENDILIALTRPYIKDGLKVCICPESYNKSLLNQRVASIRGIFSDISNEYIYLYLNSPVVLDYVKEFSRTMNQPNLSIKALKGMLIPLPSYELQIKIANEIKKLFEICDLLKEEMKQQEYMASTLNKSVFSKIIDVNNSVPLEDINFVINNIEYLCNTKEDIALLRNCILSLAIQGKLVEQLPTDEPASVLLEKIKEEKDRLIKEKRLKKEKLLPIITTDQIPYELPKGWEWTRLGDISLKIVDGTHHSPKSFSNGDYLYITAKNIKNNGVDTSNVTYVTKDIHEGIYSRCNVEKGDILLIKDGATTGIATINQLDEQFSLLSSVGLIKTLNNFINNQYLIYCFRSPLLQHQIKELMKGSAITRITIQKIKNFIIPIPSLKEQNLIVEKVNILIQLCDELDQRNEQTKQDSERLMKAVLQVPFKVQEEVLS